MTLVIDGAGGHLVGSDNAMGDSNSIIIVTESWSLVDDTSTIGVGHVGIDKDAECLVLKLFGEVVEERNVSPILHIGTLELSQLLVLGLFWIFVQGTEKLFMDDEVLVPLLIMDFDIGEVGVDTESQIRRQCPWCGRPSKERGFRIVDKRECNGDCI